MAQFDVTIPDDLRNWIDSRVLEGRYVSVSEYFAHLVRRHYHENDDDALARLRAAIEAGLRSGISHRSLDDIWKAHDAA